MSRALNAAQKDVEKNEADVAKWETRVSQEQATLTALEATLGEALLDDETAADRLPAQIDAASSRIRATRRAVAVAHQRLTAARQKALRVEADDEDDIAATHQKNADQIRGKVDQLLQQIEQIDGVRYLDPEDVAADHYRVGAGEQYTVQLSRSGLAYDAAHLHRSRAAVLRYTAEHGRVPTFTHELALGHGVAHGTPVGAELIPASAAAFARLSTTQG